MSIDTTFLRRCIASLERAVAELEGLEGLDDREDVFYDIYRAACVKEFELVLGQTGKLLRERLAAYFASNRQAHRLNFKDLFRHAAKHCLMDCEAVESWLGYRDNAAQDYGEDFPEATLPLLPAFVDDAKALADMIDDADDD